MKFSLWGIIFLSAFVCVHPVFSEEAVETKPVAREALNIQRDIVAIDLVLNGNVLQAKVTGFMHEERPKLANVLLVGPAVGRLSPTARKTVQAGLEEDAPYSTKRSGFLVLNQGSKDVAEGALTRERLEFVLPLQKMQDAIRKRGKKAHYEFWVILESATHAQQGVRFKFDLDELPELILAASE